MRQFRTAIQTIIALALLTGIDVAGMTAAGAQTREEARSDGKAFAKTHAEKARAAASTTPDADSVPNFDREAARSLQDLADEPDAIDNAARRAARSHEGLRTLKESVQRRARFAPQDIEAVIRRAGAIRQAPLDYTSGMAIGGAKGRCVPLPPGSGSAGSYFATCNSGSVAQNRSGRCTVTLTATVERRSQYHYLCSAFDDLNPDGLPLCSSFSGGSCRKTGSRPGQCLQWSGRGQQKWCVEPGLPVTEMTCQTPVAGQTAYAVTSDDIVTTAADESQCRAFEDDADCTRGAEICSGSDPMTRIVGGVPVTRPCWAWTRDYQCTARRAANDCGEIDANSGCRFVREDCIGEDMPCSIYERVYKCPLPETPGSKTQFVCDGDVYCIDGSCETIAREANDEFGDAVTALHAMDEARGQFDAASLTLFTGQRETCSSQIFGVINCCKGKGFPLVPGIGLLVALGCDREEVLLHERDAKGLCAYVGSYCASKILGLCVTKRKAYCCFESKLSRILQEQGRAQLPKPWGRAKSEQCAGFTLEEFARLDLSRMDFSEVYAEFTEAARLPDELETSNLIQQKIDDYFDRSGR